MKINLHAYAKFWAKTLLYRMTPGGFGYYRHLRRHRDRNYCHERDKHPVRRKHYGTEGWKEYGSVGINYRHYDNYEEYSDHQKQKFEEILKLKGGFNNREVTRYRIAFYRRFKFLPELLPTSALIVCAGARQGTEVEVLNELGFKNAYGIDLNPGPQNPFVRPGDFMHMENATASVDLLYSNSIDHAFDLDGLFSEHARVIKDNGYVLYDIPIEENTGPFESVRWKSEEDIFQKILGYFKSVVRVGRDGGWSWILLQGKRGPGVF